MSAALGKCSGRAKADGGKVGKASKGDVGGCCGTMATDVCDGDRRPWTKPTPVVDDDGYELVQRRRVRAPRDDPNAGEQVPVGGDGKGSGPGAATTTTRRRWSDVDDDSDVGDAADGDDGEDEDVADGGTGEGWGWEADPTRLRATFEEHARAVREMERRGSYGIALTTLRAARDEAERRWREAKPLAPLPKRLDWADTKLRKAQAALTRVRLELDAFDAETDRKRADICRRIEEAQSWYSWRREQLDALHDEAADTAPGRRAAAAESAGTCEAREKIRGKVLPEMQAILETCQEGTALHERLTLAVAGLADAEASLGGQRGDAGPARYDLGDDDSQDGQWGQEQHQGEYDDDYMDDGETGGDQTEGRSVEWRPEGPSRWTRHGVPRSGGLGRRPGEDGGPATVGPTTAQGGDARGARKGKPAEVPAGGQRDAGGETPARGSDGAATNDTGADGGERAGKHRRRQTEEEALAEDRAASDARRAQELQRQLEVASAAQEWSYAQGKGGFGSEAALSTAAQGFVLEVQRAQARANELGVEARAEDGKTLLELSPAELRRWVQDNLDVDGA